MEPENAKRVPNHATTMNSSAPKRATSFGQLKRWMCPISIAGGTLQANNASQVTPRGIPVKSWQN
jgi:hypothetical protein